MKYLVNRESRVLIYGFQTGAGGQLASDYLQKGLNLVAGVQPGRGGDWMPDGRIPIFDTISSAEKAVNPDVIAITVSPPKAYQAIIDAISSNVKTILCFTGEIPLKDLAKVHFLLQRSDKDFLGPGTFGIISPGEFSIGNFPWSSMRKGKIGLISRSRPLALILSNHLAENGLGISTAVGMGDQSDLGIGFMEFVQRFDQDPETDHIIFLDDAACKYDVMSLNNFLNMRTKPFISYIPSKKEPVNELDSFTGIKERESYLQYRFKIDSFKNAGIPTVKSILEIAELIKAS